MFAFFDKHSMPLFQLLVLCSFSCTFVLFLDGNEIQSDNDESLLKLAVRYGWVSIFFVIFSFPFHRLEDSIWKGKNRKSIIIVFHWISVLKNKVFENLLTSKYGKWRTCSVSAAWIDRDSQSSFFLKQNLNRWNSSMIQNICILFCIELGKFINQKSSLVLLMLWLWTFRASFRYFLPFIDPIRHDLELWEWWMKHLMEKQRNTQKRVRKEAQRIA